MISNPTADPHGENQAPMAHWHFQGERKESTTQGNLFSIIWKVINQEENRMFIYSLTIYLLSIRNGMQQLLILCMLCTPTLINDVTFGADAESFII